MKQVTFELKNKRNALIQLPNTPFNLLAELYEYVEENIESAISDGDYRITKEDLSSGLFFETVKVFQREEPSNAYCLTDDIRRQFTPVIAHLIASVSADAIKSLTNEEYHDLVEINLTGQPVNPFQLGELLKEMGFEEEDRDENGWQLDCWLNYQRGDTKLQISLTGITFEMRIRNITLD